MILRPVDENGDILPVLSPAALLRDAPAAAALVRERLELLAGDWWENPAWGNRALEMLRDARPYGADAQALAAYLSSYIRETEGVLEVRDMEYTVEGSVFRFSCVVETADGSESIEYTL